MKLIAQKIGNNHGGNWVAEYELQTEKTLRDEFAMMYMNGVVSRMNIAGEYIPIAEHSYKMADAMMKAREK